jgi:hypothetical protein
MTSSTPLRTGGNIIELRHLLAQQFPGLRQTLADRKRPQTLATGIAAMDALLDGGLPRGAFTELVAFGHGSGSAEVIHQFLHRVAAQHQFLALVDGRSSFDVGAVQPAILSRLLWVRCEKTSEALKAADLLLRDRNFPFLALDLKLNPVRELRKITASIWFRYARLLEQNQTTVLVVTPQALVSVAAYRLSIESRLGMEALWQSRAELLSGLRFTLLRAEIDGSVAAQSG